MVATAKITAKSFTITVGKTLCACGEIQNGSQDMPDTKVALMTGTGQGIGRGCAIQMAKAGYKVSLMSPSNRSIDLAKELDGIGRSGSVLDIASEGARYINGQSILADGGMNRAVR